jgi:hypothetical protein
MKDPEKNEEFFKKTLELIASVSPDPQSDKEKAGSIKTYLDALKNLETIIGACVKGSNSRANYDDLIVNLGPDAPVKLPVFLWKGIVNMYLGRLIPSTMPLFFQNAIDNLKIEEFLNGGHEPYYWSGRTWESWAWFGAENKSDNLINAINAYKTAVTKNDEKDGEYHFRLGKCQFIFAKKFLKNKARTEKYQEAISNLKVPVDQFSCDPDHYYWLAKAIASYHLFAKSDDMRDLLGQAINHCDTAIEFGKSANPKVHLLKGLSQRRLADLNQFGNKVNLLELSLESLSISYSLAEDPDTAYEIGKVYIELAQSSYGQDKSRMYESGLAFMELAKKKKSKIFSEETLGDSYVSAGEDNMDFSKKADLIRKGIACFRAILSSGDNEWINYKIDQAIRELPFGERSEA